MAQHDYVIDNQSGASFRSDLNNALAAIVSQNSGSTAPATTYAYMMWPDTTTGLLKMRNGANTDWITLRELDGDFATIPVNNGSAAAPSIYFSTSGTDTGFYSSGTDAIDVATAGTRRFGWSSGGDVTVYGGNVTLNGQGDLRFADSDSSNWVAFQGASTIASNVTWTLPSADGTSGQVLSTNGSGTLSWASAGGGGDVTLAGNNAMTGANTFTNTTGQIFRYASTQDGVLLRGRAGGTNSYTVELVPTTLSASRTLTLPNVTDTVAVLGTAQTFTAVQTLTDPAIIGTIKEDVYTISDGAAFEIDPGNGSVQLITLGASRTPKATNFTAGESVTLMVDDGTAYTLTWTDSTFGGSGVVWKTDSGVAPTLNTSGYTVIVLWKVSTQVYGARVGNA
jgi:hypothetical protein